MAKTILAVDDEPSIRQLLERYFSARGFHVLLAEDGETALEICRSQTVDLMLLDLRLPGMDGMAVLQTVKKEREDLAVIMITAHGDVETAVRAMQLKADNFALKPITIHALGIMVDNAIEIHRARGEVEYLKDKVARLAGKEAVARLRHPPEIHHAISLLAANPSTTVLLLGPTGSGKGALANAIHEMSARRGFPLVDVNCAGLTPEFLESELFGHEKGAFTGASSTKRGLLEIANNGSVFFDEIGEMALSVQAKLLKVIESKTFRRLGGTQNLAADVRIMAATNINLEAAVKAGRFREDLYFRLNVIPVQLPPLRQRREDILPLAQQFLEEFRPLLAKQAREISPEAEAAFLAYSWPGNIRELRNVMERAVLLCEGQRIETRHLPESLRAKGPAAPAIGLGRDLTLDTLEKNHISTVLAACGDNRSQAAALLGIHRSTLIAKIKKYGLE